MSTPCQELHFIIEGNCWDGAGINEIEIYLAIESSPGLTKDIKSGTNCFSVKHSVLLR